MRLRLLLIVAAVAGGVAFALGGAGPANATSGFGCIAHHPAYVENVFEVRYAPAARDTTSRSSIRSRAPRAQRVT